jgi:hypothetical protein
VCGNLFPSGEEHAAASHGREQEWKIDGSAEYVCAQLASRNGDTLPRAKCHAFERTAVLTKRDLAFGSAVDVIEHYAWKATLSEAAQVADIDDVRSRKPRHVRVQSA